MSALTKRERSIASKFRKYEKAREEAKKFYDRADRLLLDIARKIQPKTRCRIRDDGRELVVKDVLAEAGDSVIVGWGHGAVRRFELKVIDP